MPLTVKRKWTLSLVISPSMLQLYYGLNSMASEVAPFQTIPTLWNEKVQTWEEAGKGRMNMMPIASVQKPRHCLQCTNANECMRYRYRNVNASTWLVKSAGMKT